MISAEEYKKKVMALRKKVSSLQTERSKLLDSIAKQRSKARTELLKTLNPIIRVSFMIFVGGNIFFFIGVIIFYHLFIIPLRLLS